MPQLTVYANLCPTDVYHTKQNQLVLTCRARGNPLPIIEWTKDDVPIVLDERMAQAETLEGLCELAINEPTPEDSGYYACIATNSEGTIEQEHRVFYPQLVETIRTIFPEPPPEEEPAIDTVGADASAGVVAVPDVATDAPAESVPIDGAVVAVALDVQPLAVEPEAAPEPPPPPKQRRVNPLTVLDVDPDYVRRHVLPTLEQMQQAVRRNLSFATYLTNRVFPAGSNAKLSCVSQGPDPNARWTKDGQPIVTGPLIKTTAHDGLFGLEIANCTPEHSGVYEVTVRNAECAVSSSCTVQVYDSKLTADLAPTFTRNLKRE